MDLKNPKANLYELLNVERDAPESTIRSSYRKLAKTCHPDKTKDPKSADLFLELTEALNVLTISETRQKYDKELRKKDDALRASKQKDIHENTLRETLLAKEKSRVHNEVKETEEAELSNKIKSLRIEADHLLNQEKDFLFERLKNLEIQKKEQSRQPLIKLKWDKNTNVYSKSSLAKIFSKYGEIENIVVKNHSALIEFKEFSSACIAAKAEEGFNEYKLLVKPMFKNYFIHQLIFVRYQCVKVWPCDLSFALKEIEKYVFKKLINFS